MTDQWRIIINPELFIDLSKDALEWIVKLDPMALLDFQSSCRRALLEANRD